MIYPHSGPCIMTHLKFFVFSTLATRTDVVRLQDLCIDCVARSVKSSEDVQSLNLPYVVKDEIVKVLLNPNEYFLC